LTCFVFSEDLVTCRGNLALERKRLGDPPYTDKTLSDWNAYVENFRLGMEALNEKIHRFNLVVPMLHRQVMPYNYSKELQKVCDNHQDFLPEDYDAILTFRESNRHSNVNYSSASMETVKFSDIWKEVRGFFRKGEIA